MRTGIVLAGGRASRFGGDKLAADLDGTSVLEATIAAVAAVTDRIIVAGPALPEGPGLPAGLRAGETPVDLVRDAEPFAGPLAALSNVLREAAADPNHLAIVVGGDMPRLVPAVLRSMLDHLAQASGTDAVLLDREPPGAEAEGGRPPRRAVLPLAVRVDVAARAATMALESGDRSLRALVDRLAHVALPASTWVPLDPRSNTLLDVDTTADLERVRRYDLR